MPGLGRKGVPLLPDASRAPVAVPPRPVAPVPDGPYALLHGDVWRIAPGPRREGVLSGMSDTHVCDGSQRLAVAFLDDALVKHGEETAVARWVAAQRERALAAGEDDPCLPILSFQPLQGALDALNRCIAGYGGVDHMVEALSAMPEADTPAPPSYPR